MVTINAAMRVGVPFCQYHSDFRSWEVEFILGFTEASVLVVPREFRGFDYIAMFEELRPRLPKLEHVFVVGDDVPALVFVGTTGLGAGFPGGKGILLDHCHPRHLDQVAARYPEFKVLAARPAWSWQTEMIAVLLHKANVWYELHGWSPKYLTDDLKREIAGRLKDQVMFGADYPLLSYERLIGDWRNLGYEDEVLEKVFHRNAEAFLAGLGR